MVIRLVALGGLSSRPDVVTNTCEYYACSGCNIYTAIVLFLEVSS